MSPSREPVIFENSVDIRFADLDHYNHVNSSHYIDLVNTSRLNFMSHDLKLSIEEVTKEGLDFL